MRPAHDKSYFHFTKKERNGILFLTSLTIISVAVPALYPYIFQSSPQPAQRYADDIARLRAHASDSSSTRPRYIREYKPYKPYPRTENPIVNSEVFYFDPNTISMKEWKKLGLRDKTILTIQNYLAKGGRFRQPADIKKIWGLHEALAERLLPYVRISNSDANSRVPYTKGEFQKTFITKTYEAVDLNEGDTTALTKLPGIGPKLAQRIIKYRDRLGGFHKVDQVAETFGLPDSTFQKIRGSLQVNTKSIRRINVNTATLEELKVHPYIRYHLANALVQYRQQHTSYTSVNEIRNIMLVDDTTYQKLAPYLTVE